MPAQQTSAVNPSASSKSSELSNVYIGQNVPNPFTNFTSIAYTLPQKFVTAKIVITNKNGKITQQPDISGSSKGILHIGAAAQSTGVYSYALYADGRLIASRQMILIK